ncbi:MAG: S8 family serine peptidase [Candidatus Daviesbacteria bacterium]|nr:MAG: S8 family serine peptidase [Candidatus Daviesbacteria bacterium]
MFKTALLLFASFLYLFLAAPILATETNINLNLNTSNNSAEGNLGESKIQEGNISVNIPGEYIVVFKDEVQNPAEVADQLQGQHQISIKHKYSKPLKGFSANITDQKIEQIRQDSRVKFISQDKKVFALSHRTTAVQSTPTGIRRINGIQLNNYGDGIGVAVIDTGIDLDHPDLAGNILANVNCIRPLRKGDDDNGHGTHVAGTIAALQNNLGVVGVAPQAKLMAVKVLDSRGSGTWSSVICGIDWVTQNASKFNIKVANMSLGGGGQSDNNCGSSNQDALHQAICRSASAGITYVAAAGNSNQDAGLMVPAAYDDALITVSALSDSDGLAGGLGSATTYGADDTFASFSNFGSVVDLAAPGVSINSTWVGGRYKSISGTSMASPHVAGTAALYLKSNPGATWTQVRDSLKALAEILGSGHSDPSNKHPEPVVLINGF